MHSHGHYVWAAVKHESLCCRDFCLCSFSYATALFSFYFQLHELHETHKSFPVSAITPLKHRELAATYGAFVIVIARRDSRNTLRPHSTQLTTGERKMNNRAFFLFVCLRSLQFDPAPRRGEPHVTRRTPDYFL